MYAALIVGTSRVEIKVRILLLLFDHSRFYITRDIED